MTIKIFTLERIIVIEIIIKHFTFFYVYIKQSSIYLWTWLIVSIRKDNYVTTFKIKLIPNNIYTFLLNLSNKAFSEVEADAFFYISLVVGMYRIHKRLGAIASNDKK